MAVVLIAAPLVEGTTYGVRLDWWLYAIPAVVWLAAAAVSEWVIRRDERRHRRNRARFIESLPRSDSELLATELGRLWRRRADPPDCGAARRAVRRAQAAPAKGATIICFGLIDVPKVNNELFEPVIITPTRYLWRMLWPLPLALAVAGLWAAAHFDPWRFPLVVLGLAAAALAIWLYRASVRPTYVRLAPGIVQIMRFGLRAGRPTIRSYPLIAGTTVMLVNTHIETSTRLTVRLACGAMHDELPLKQMRNHAQLVEQVWRALLSTAPTPPLSDEELVG